jgi:hypothetical protein
MHPDIVISIGSSRAREHVAEATTRRAVRRATKRGGQHATKGRRRVTTADTILPART